MREAFPVALVRAPRLITARRAASTQPEPPALHDALAPAVAPAPPEGAVVAASRLEAFDPDDGEIPVALARGGGVKAAADA